MSRARLERCGFPCPRPERKEPLEPFTKKLRFTTARRSNRGEREKKNEKEERTRGRSEEEGSTAGECCVLPIVRDHCGEHVGIEREQVVTFREEIARRTDTSRARSSYPQHPAVAVAAAVEGDEAEHARNSVPSAPLSSPSDGLQPPIRPSACSPPHRFHPPRLSSPWSTSAAAASTPCPSFRAEFAPSSMEFDFTPLLPTGVYINPSVPKAKTTDTDIFPLLGHSNFEYAFKCVSMIKSYSSRRNYRN